MDKENLNERQRIISALKPDGKNLIDVTIFHLNNESALIEKIISKKADISEKEWVLNDVTVFKPSDGILVVEKLKVKKIVSLYDRKNRSLLRILIPCLFRYYFKL